MAQTKRKRRSKHRGTAAGTIEARGRTGRKPDGSERKPQTREEVRRARMDRPPTWGSAVTRAGIAASLLLVFTLVGIGPQMDVAQSIAIAAFAMLLYIPLGYYTDVFVYRRRQRKRAEQAAAAKPR